MGGWTHVEVRDTYQATCAVFPKCIVSHPAYKNHSHILLLLRDTLATILRSVGGGARLQQTVQVSQDQPVCTRAENTSEDELRGLWR